MAKALERPAESGVLRRHRGLTFQSGAYQYSITRQGEQSIYSVTDGKQTIAVPILYVFGQGKAGQTYVLRHGGELYESRVSFYERVGGLDLTLGAPSAAPTSLEAALGRRMNQDDVRDCFGCHATAAVNGPKAQLDKLVPGVRCEACHGPGARHVAAVKAGNLKQKQIFNPAALGGDELNQEFCGACHRSASDVVTMPAAGGTGSVRFQPYRMFTSRCYSDDRRISCTACHDPHADPEQAPEFYDAKCLACHQADGKGGAARAPHPKQTRGCVSCHMPKVELPGSHFKFTDHQIRVVKPGAAP